MMRSVHTGSDAAWPLVRSSEVLAGETVAVRVLGAELVLWRDDAGQVNLWEDRCPHRGVRLAIGTNTGTNLVCRYHGWSFASGSGRCTFIPAHPANVPPAAARATARTCAERYDFVWLLGDGTTSVPPIERLDGTAVTTLRSITFHAPAAAVLAALGTLTADPALPEPVFLVLPETDAETTVHGAVPGQLEGDERMRVRRETNRRLKELRAAVEAHA
jgi:vanillate O-demethylase ferredoxin subunit